MKERKNKKLNKDPYKGTRDFYPEEMFLQNYIFSKMKEVVGRYGYVEYSASLLEETDLYRAKTGSEIVEEQTYSFTDRGGREITIRPEMTPTIARMVARRRKDLAFPLRWYSIPNLFRYERPQRGRLREHWQLNVDLFGIDAQEADAEIVNIAYDILKSFGAKDDEFLIHINNRKFINYVLNEYFNLKKEDAYQLSKLIDRKAKIKRQMFVSEVEKVLHTRTDELITILECNSISEVPEVLATNPGLVELQTLQELLEKRGIMNYAFEPSLVRGFDYYTGTIFEVFDTSPENNRSLFGGGRYDDLVAMFGVEKVSGVGFGMGDVTIADFLKTHNKEPERTSTTKLYLCTLGEEYIPYANELAAQLRDQGISVAVDYTSRKVAKQIKTAEKQNIPFSMCIGEREATEQKNFRLKNLVKREEEELPLKDLIKKITAY